MLCSGGLQSLLEFIGDPYFHAAEAKDQVSGVRAGRHENPHSISLNA